MPDQQESLSGLQATRVKFVGMAADGLESLPELDDEMTFLVTAVCTARGEERMKDGERRPTARMDVKVLVPQGGPVKPAAAAHLFSVDDGDAGPDDGDGE